MIHRSYDTYLLSEAVRYLIKEGLPDFDPIDWVSNSANVMLANEFGDIAIFHNISPGQSNGHYYFKSRGKQALVAAKNFLDEAFRECYNIIVIRGFTPLTYLGPRWLSRQIGFKSYGIVRVKNRPYELFILHRSQHIEGTK